MTNLERSQELFVRVSLRVGEALRRGELTLGEHVVLVTILHLDTILALNPKRSHGPPDVIVIELAELAAATTWPTGIEELRRTLHRLNAKGWIAAAAVPGSKKWTVRLTGAKLDGEEGENPKLHLTDAPQVEVQVELSSTVVEVGRGANADHKRDPNTSEPPPGGGQPSKRF